MDFSRGQYVIYVSVRIILTENEFLYGSRYGNDLVVIQ